jgi:hypothetical protein
MDIALLTKFIAPFLPALINLGEKASEKMAEELGENAWNKAKAIWTKLQLQVAAKPDLMLAIEQCHPQVVHFSGHGVGFEMPSGEALSTRKLGAVCDTEAEPEGLVFLVLHRFV